VVEIGKWYHIVCYWDGSGWTEYLNGTSEGSAFSTGASGGIIYETDTNTELTLGPKMQQGSPYNLGTASGDGIVDEIYIGDASDFNGDINDIVTFLYSNGAPGTAQQYPFTSGGANESEARAAIETGITNVLPNAEIYTDRQMHLRYDNGNQSLVRFDKVAYYNDQYFAFNYYTDDSNQSAPQMGNSFFSWLNESLSEADITVQVENMIEKNQG
jgi:hypothetical protein